MINLIKLFIKFSRSINPIIDADAFHVILSIAIYAQYLAGVYDTLVNLWTM